MIEIDFETKSLERALTRLERDQLPFALSRALNDTARDIRGAWSNEIKNKLDRPTPFTQRGVFVQGSNKRNLTAVVGIKDVQARYLQWQVEGGVQRPKRRAIPIAHAQRRNKYGNAPRGALKRALKKPNTFSGKVNGRAGVWQRMRGRRQKVKLLFGYHGKATYGPRLNLVRPAKIVSRRVFLGHASNRLTQAIATARR